MVPQERKEFWLQVPNLRSRFAASSWGRMRLIFYNITRVKESSRFMWELNDTS